jgi:hypothetical protein
MIASPFTKTSSTIAVGIEKGIARLDNEMLAGCSTSKL